MRRYEVTDFPWHFLVIFYKVHEDLDAMAVMFSSLTYFNSKLSDWVEFAKKGQNVWEKTGRNVW